MLTLWVVGDRSVPAGKNILFNQVISLFQHARKEKNLFFRRIVVWDEQNHQELVFLTNHLKFCHLHHGRHLQRPLANRIIL